ncbi:MAG: radical SAM family heme chaperone HemW [Lachnospiraceae bacterium]|nr:radical SAM family heme chaperone HemW [Lachnospiraceae bacterium]
MNNIGLYLHYPFCVRKCRYCDFLSAPADDSFRAAYIKRLEEEIAMQSERYGRRGDSRRAVTIFIGGGTPSLMSEKEISGLMDCIYRNFEVAEDAEISMEVNPGTADIGKLSAMKNAGINRLSFGLQSMNNEELERLGRIHNAEQFLESYDAARNAGFTNINIDLMSALPGQTAESFGITLRKAARLSPEHLSCYSLIIEEGTPFWSIYGEGSLPEGMPELPSEDEEREMYRMTKEILSEYGYSRYEISNYAKPGYECRHNISYWVRNDYLGFGPGAASLIGNRRFTNTRSVNQYMKDFALSEDEPLDERVSMAETVFLGLRMTEGVDCKAFINEFGRSLEDVYGDVIEKYTATGHLKKSADGSRLMLTEDGIDVSNVIVAEFL